MFVFRLILTLVLMLPMSEAFSQTYVHPSGATFEYPQNWYTTQLEEGVLVTPQPVTPQTTIDQFDRYFWVGAQAVSQHVALTGADTISFFDSLISMTYPTQRRAGAAVVDSDVTRLEYVVDETRKVRVRYKFVQGLALYVAYSATNEQIENQEFATLFDSYHIPLQTDNALVGSWYASDNSMSDIDYSDAGTSYVAAAYQVTFYFGEDNRFARSSSSQVSGQSASGAGTGSVYTAADDPTDYGTYSANGAELNLAYEEGDQIDCQYRVFQDHKGLDALKLRCESASKPKYFRRTD